MGLLGPALALWLAQVGGEKEGREAANGVNRIEQHHCCSIPLSLCLSVPWSSPLPAQFDPSPVLAQLYPLGWVWQGLVTFRERCHFLHQCSQNDHRWSAMYSAYDTGSVFYGHRALSPTAQIRNRIRLLKYYLQIQSQKMFLVLQLLILI